MKKEIVIQRAWLEGLLEHGNRLHEQAKKKPLSIENMALNSEVHTTIGYINSAEFILKND